MNQPEPFLVRSARWLTFGSVAAILLSIAVSHTLLGLAVAALLLSGEQLRLPPIKLPLALFMVGTVISLAFSGEIAAGLPGVRKFYVFLVLLVVFSTLRNAAWLRALVLAWAGLGALGAMRGLVQFAAKMKEAHQLGRNFYEYYAPGNRITGFMSHWMTFSGQEMFCLIMLVAFLFFAPKAFRKGWVWILCVVLLVVALALGMTRSVWLASAVAGIYLLWFWRRWLVALLPVAGILAALVAPVEIRERLASFTRPTKVDSNAFRFVAWQTGLRIIERHPLLGLGPEGVKFHFDEYVAPEVPRPLPIGSYEHLHNIYLQYAAERGIPTMLCMIWLLFKVLWDFGKSVRKLSPGRSNARFLLHGAIAVVVATMVEGFFEHNLGDTEVLTMFLVAVCCGYLALDQEVVAVREPVPVSAASSRPD